VLIQHCIVRQTYSCFWQASVLSENASISYPSTPRIIIPFGTEELCEVTLPATSSRICVGEGNWVMATSTASSIDCRPSWRWGSGQIDATTEYLAGAFGICAVTIFRPGISAPGRKDEFLDGMRSSNGTCTEVELGPRWKMPTTWHAARRLGT